VRGPVFFYQIGAVLPDGLGETRIAGKGRILFPAIGEEGEPAERKGFDERLLEPLARRRGLGERAPAVAQDMAELVPELVGELAPVERADIDDDPRRLWRILMEPDRRRARGMFVDTEASPVVGRRRVLRPSERLAAFAR